MLLPLHLLAQLDGDSAAKIMHAVPQTPMGWVGWLVVGLVAVITMATYFLFRYGLARQQSSGQAEAPAPPCYVPAPAPGSPQSQACALDHGGMRERMATLEGQSSEMLRRGEVILSQGGQALERAEQILRRLDMLIALTEKERDLEQLRAELAQQRFLQAIATAGGDTVKTLSERVNETMKLVVSEASRVIAENRRSIDDAAGG